MYSALLSCIGVISIVSICASFIGVPVLKHPVVNTKSGPVRGALKYSRDGRPFYSFTKIPYAQPPVGPNRFRAPKFVSPWEHVLDAQEDAPSCIQKNYLASKKPAVEGTEDCLYINVYTPKMRAQEIYSKNELLPVMVFIHWGGFFTGYSNAQYLGPEYFMDEDVVLVTFNYRLGVMGFLSTNDDASPGNWALKDQVAALRWVRAHIEAFAGDKNLVTIFGQSAGSASVHFHLLSPQTKGLFHRAISQSGTALNLWATPKNEIQKLVAETTATFVGCGVSVNNSCAMVDCLRLVDAAELVDSGDKFKTFDVEPIAIFGPVTEKRTLHNPKPYITQDPSVQILNREFHNVPWMVGVVQNEGILRASPLLRPNETRGEMNANFDSLVPSSILALATSVPATEVDRIWQYMKEFYFAGANYVDAENEDLVQGFIDIISDRAFVYGIYQSALLQSAKGHTPIWFYNFNYRGAYSYGDYFATTVEDIDFDWGTSHCDDLLYLFRSPAVFPELPPNSSDVTMSKIMVKMWTDFAKYGDPTPRKQPNGIVWETVQGVTDENKNLRFLNISGTFSTDATDNIRLQNENGFFTERMKFVDSLPFFENINLT